MSADTLDLSSETGRRLMTAILAVSSFARPAIVELLARYGVARLNQLKSSDAAAFESDLKLILAGKSEETAK